MIKRFFIWLLITLQYRSFKAYQLYKEEQKRREDEQEGPFENTWVFKIQRWWWEYKHMHNASLSTAEILEMYENVLEKMAAFYILKKNDTYKLIGHQIRISGNTLVLDEKYSINPQDNGVYVHFRENPEDDWKLVYRTSWLAKDLRWIGTLGLFSEERSSFLPEFRESKQIGIKLSDDNSLYPTVSTLIQ